MYHPLRLIAATAAVGVGAAVLAWPAATAEQLPNNFQPRASINDPAQERTVQEWRAERTLTAADTNGAALFLRSGATYTVEISGTFSYWADAPAPWTADAECSIESTGQYSPEPTTWVPDRWVEMYGNDYLDVKRYVQVGDVERVVEIDWEPVDPFTDPAAGRSSCSASHRYRTQFQAQGEAVRFAIDDTAGPADNAGHLVLTISGPPPVFDQDYQCPKWTEEQPNIQPAGTLGEIDEAHVLVDSRRDAGSIPDPADRRDAAGEPLAYWQEAGHFGIYTCNWVVPGSTYVITVEGSYQWAPDAGYRADAECSRTPEDGQFRADRFVEQSPELRDWLDLYAHYRPLEWTPMGRIDPSDPRCSLDHTYCVLFTPDFAGPLSLKLYDTHYNENDNVGTLKVSIKRVEV